MTNETCWLIERKTLNTDGKVIYTAKHGGGTDKPFDAMRFRTRQEARDNIPLLRAFPHEWHAVEHIFTHGYRHKRTIRGFIMHWFNRLILRNNDV